MGASLRAGFTLDANHLQCRRVRSGATIFGSVDLTLEREPLFNTGHVRRRSNQPSHAPLPKFVGRVYYKYTMPTSVHIPKALLIAVDRRARALKISRNRLIVQALEREVTEGSKWSPDFFDQLESIQPDVEEAAEEMVKAIQSQRRSKKPVRL